MNQYPLHMIGVSLSRLGWVKQFTQLKSDQYLSLDRNLQKRWVENNFLDKIRSFWV